MLSGKALEQTKGRDGTKKLKTPFPLAWETAGLPEPPLLPFLVAREVTRNDPTKGSKRPVNVFVSTF